MNIDRRKHHGPFRIFHISFAAFLKRYLHIG